MAIRRLRPPVIALAITLTLTLTSCALLKGENSTAEQQPGQLEKIKLRLLRVVDIIPVELAKSQGYFTAEGLDVEIDFGTKGSENIINVLGGSVDIAQTSYPPAISAHAKAGKLKVVWDAVETRSAEGQETVLVMVKKGSPIHDITDLKGKKIANSSPGGISEMGMDAQLRAHQMTASDVHYVPTEFQNMPSMIDAGQVDAAIIIEPYIQVAYKAGMTKLLNPFTGDTNEFPWSGYVASAEWAKDKGNRAKIDKFQRAMRKGVDYAKDHRTEAEAIMVDALKIEPAIAPLVHESTYPISIDPTRLQRVVKLMSDNGEKGPNNQPIQVDMHTMLLDPE